MKHTEEQKQRFALTLLLSAVIFCTLLMTDLLVGSFIFLADRLGWLQVLRHPPTGFPFFCLTALISVVVGTVLSAWAGRFPLRPVNTVINAMNRLAAGDFSVRLHSDGLMERHPTVTELSESFNTMAEELESTELLRSDFINNFSHEFKTPIVSIAGFAKLLKRGDLTEEERREYLDIIEAESLRLAAMATNVLELTKVENQTILTDVTRYDLSEQLRSCALELEQRWTAKRLELLAEFDEVEIAANEPMLRQLWLNLLDNAVKFTPDCGTVKLGIERLSGAVRVTVSNTGPEIAPDKREKIFHKFYQADESHAGQGSGVGLAVAKQIVALHGGAIAVDCRGGWTHFTVTLPDGGA